MWIPEEVVDKKDLNDPDNHNAPVQLEEARAVIGPFPDDLGPHGSRQG